MPGIKHEGAPYLANTGRRSHDRHLCAGMLGGYLKGDLFVCGERRLHDESLYELWPVWLRGVSGSVRGLLLERKIMADQDTFRQVSVYLRQTTCHLSL